MERFTVLVGPNSSGKSSILQGIDRLCRMSPGSGDKNATINRCKDLLPRYSRGGRGAMELRCEIYQSTFSLKLVPGREDKDGNVSEWDAKQCLVPPAIVVDDSKHQTRTRVSSILLQLDPTFLATPEYSDETEPKLRPNGSGLHSMLAHLSLTDHEAFTQLEGKLRAIVPSFGKIRFRREKVSRPETRHVQKGDSIEANVVHREYMTHSILFDMSGANNVPADQVSQGTLLTLGILAALYSPSRPQVILLDDLDRGLHPKAQLGLVSLLRSFLDQNPDLQIIATTHSPYILDRLKPEEVRLVYQSENGSSVCGRLQDHPEFERWKEEMTPGEFWMMFGEKWLDRQPEAAQPCP